MLVLVAIFVTQLQVEAILAVEEVFTSGWGVSLELMEVLSLMCSSQRLLQRTLYSIQHFRLT